MTSVGSQMIPSRAFAEYVESNAIHRLDLLKRFMVEKYSSKQAPVYEYADPLVATPPRSAKEHHLAHRIDRS